MPFVAEALNLWLGWLGAALMFCVFGLISGTVALRTQETAPRPGKSSS